ncbi:Aldo/keto reductase [Venturia nashicola]|uniref:Aldo/keto reductase n=1 Tax=Venturia nashicola TaxID=86259 RepID=A0A4Z1NYR7_9PEZI|nr:Aldo/keto reductase [Venturia nashicola]
MSNLVDKVKDKVAHSSSEPTTTGHATGVVKLVNRPIGPIGYGLMGLTWRAKPPSSEQSLDAMRASLRVGANFWNGGELYGTPERNSLHLLNDYFTKYPEDAEKVVLSIKGGLKPGEHAPDGSEANIQRSIDECLRVLDGKKFLDLFECARVDPNTPIETTIAAIDNYVQAGKLGGISLSEVSEQTIRKAAQVAKISAVEVEFSLWSTDILTNGVAKACSELNIPIVAYSPIGRGFLTGDIKKPEDLGDDDMRKTMPRFQGEAFYENIKLVKEIEKVAVKKGAKPGQVAIAWVRAHSGRDGLPLIIPIPGSSTAARVEENSKDVTLTEAELEELNDILRNFTPVGGRYGGPAAKLMEG